MAGCVSPSDRTENFCWPSWLNIAVSTSAARTVNPFACFRSARIDTVPSLLELLLSCILRTMRQRARWGKEGGLGKSSYPGFCGGSRREDYPARPSVGHPLYPGRSVELSRHP